MKFISFIFRGDRTQLILATVASVASGFASAGLMGYIGSQFTSDERIGPVAVVAFLALTVFALGAGLAARWILVRLVGGRTLRLQMDLAGRLIATPLPKLESIGSARLFAIMTDDARAIADALTRIPDVIISSALIIGSIAYLGWLSPTALSVLVLIAIPVVVLYRRFHARVRRLLVRFFDLRDERYQQYQALTEGTKELQIDAPLRRRFVGKNLEVKGEEFRGSQEQVIMAHEITNVWSQAAYFIFVFALLVLIRGEVVSNEILGTYALIALYMRSAMMQLTAVIPVWTQANGALARIEGLGLAEGDEAGEEEKPSQANRAETETTEPDTTKTDTTETDTGRDADGSETVHISVDDVSFRYPGAEGGYDFALGPVSFELRSGEVVFITGGNGSGKTTLMKLLCALYEPTEGTITCNGQQIVTAEDRLAYRANLSVLFADGFLFEELIGLEDTSSEGADLANRFLQELDLTDKVSVESGKLSTTKLSTGERRRLALLGAYLRDRPVYAFDEWAANQDPVFKQVFYRTLLPELRRRGKLVIVISHDDSFFDEADRVLQLADGTLIESSISSPS